MYALSVAGIQGTQYRISCSLHKGLAFTDIDKASGNDIGSCTDLTGGAVKSYYDNDKSVLTKMLPVTKNDRPDIANTKPIGKTVTKTFAK